MVAIVTLDVSQNRNLSSILQTLRLQGLGRTAEQGPVALGFESGRLPLGGERWGSGVGEFSCKLDAPSLQEGEGEEEESQDEDEDVDEDAAELPNIPLDPWFLKGFCGRTFDAMSSYIMLYYTILYCVVW